MKFITAAASATLFMAFVAMSLLAACDPAGADTSLPKPGIFGPGKSRIWKLDQIGKVHKPGWTIQKQVDTIEYLTGCPLSAAFAKYGQTALFVIDNTGLNSNVEGKAYVKTPFNWYRLIDFQLDFTSAFAEVRYERPLTFKTKHQRVGLVLQHYRATVLSLGEYLYLSPDFELPDESSIDADLATKSPSSSSSFSCLVYRLFHGKNATYALERADEVPIPIADCPSPPRASRLDVIAESGLFIMAGATVYLVAIVVAIAFTIRCSI